jgi:phosphoribosylformimino-5-aminoimidazole carboxamide ribotide isomerase
VILYPAIDLKGGVCVRLRQGDMRDATVFNRDPAAQASAFEAAGFAWLHIVDLDGAVSGQAVNAGAVKSILAAVRLPVQLGGGIRTLAQMSAWLDAGVARIVLGTVAVRDPPMVREACRRFPGRISVGIDARSGRVAIEGWAKSGDIGAQSLARRCVDAGVSTIIYTDIDRDGMMQGVNVEATAILARAVAVPVIASGGVSSLDDIRALKAEAASGISGAIIGRALYDGQLDPRAALEAAAAPC